MVAKPESEKDTERYLKERIESYGGLTYKIETNYTRGLPDRILIFPAGTHVWVEVKSEGEKPTLYQLKMHQILQDHGCIVEVVDTKDDVDMLLLAIGALDELHRDSNKIKANVWSESKNHYSQRKQG